MPPTWHGNQSDQCAHDDGEGVIRQIAFSAGRLGVAHRGGHAFHFTGPAGQFNHVSAPHLGVGKDRHRQALALEADQVNAFQILQADIISNLVKRFADHILVGDHHGADFHGEGQGFLALHLRADEFTGGHDCSQSSGQADDVPRLQNRFRRRFDNGVATENPLDGCAFKPFRQFGDRLIGGLALLNFERARDHRHKGRDVTGPRHLSALGQFNLQFARRLLDVHAEQPRRDAAHEDDDADRSEHVGDGKSHGHLAGQQRHLVRCEAQARERIPGGAHHRRGRQRARADPRGKAFAEAANPRDDEEGNQGGHALDHRREHEFERRTVQPAEEFRAALESDGIDEQREADGFQGIGQRDIQLSNHERHNERPGHAAEAEPFELHPAQGAPKKQRGEEGDLRSGFQDLVQQFHDQWRLLPVTVSCVASGRPASTISTPRAAW